MNAAGKMEKHYAVNCFECGREIRENKTHTFCDKCGGILEVKLDLDLLKERLNLYDLKNTKISVLKYLDFYPIQDFRYVISLEEGGTPLLKMEKLCRKVGVESLFIKNEAVNPTGVFKDRGTLVEIAKAREIGSKAIIVASSGNMAASCAAYAAKAGMACYVLVPEKTPLGKMAQLLSFGAHVVKIQGEYNDCIGLVQKLASEHGLYLAGDYVFRREGQKSIAYEICEQLGFRAPDFVVCPTGAGTNLAGIWKGFAEFYKLGLISKLPKLVAVQADGAAPLAEAFKNGHKKYKKWEKTNTICSAVAVSDPVDGNLALKSVRDSGGVVVSMSDTDALKYQKIFASLEAIFVEPSSALSIACLSKLVREKVIGKKNTVVCIATGNGLKDPLAAMQNFPKPPVFGKDYKKVSAYIGKKLK